MRERFPGGLILLERAVKFAAACLLCTVALLLPYRGRVLYGRALAWAAHAPFLAFGALARRMLKNLGYLRPGPQA